MTREETVTLLRNRSALTSQPYSHDVAELWHEALERWPYRDCRLAMLKAAGQHTKVTLAHVIEELPKRSTPLPPRIDCVLCDGTGEVPAPPHIAHDPRRHHDEEHPCRCHAVMPCRCTAGDRRAPVLARIASSRP